MNLDRIEKIQMDNGLVNFTSANKALLQVWDECVREHKQECKGCVNKDVYACRACGRSKPDYYRAEPEEHPLVKFITLGLDMEFSDKGYERITIGKLVEIDGKGDYKYVPKAGNIFKLCRLRPNHFHLWLGKSEINPIPDDCEYRVYSQLTGWCAWFSSLINKRYWDNKQIIGFEVRYTE